MADLASGNAGSSMSAGALMKQYALGFESMGRIPHKGTYMDQMQKFDGRIGIRSELEKVTGISANSTQSFEWFNKALSISGLASGTTDLSIVPVYLDPTIVDVTRRKTPLVELIPRVTNYGRTAEYARLTARGIGGYLNEDAAFTETNDTYARNSTTIRQAFEVGRVTGFALAASRPFLSQQYIDALNLEVRNKTVSLRYVEEDAMINGNNSSTRTAYGGATTISGAEPTGLRNLITTNNTDYTSNNNISIPTLRTLVRNARTAGGSTTLGEGDPNLMLTDYATLDAIKGVLQDFNRYVNINYEVAWGLRTVEFEGLPVIASRFMPETASTREVLVLSTDTIQNRVLQDVTYEELAKTNDSMKFMIKLYNAPIITAQEFNARGYNFA